MVHQLSLPKLELLVKEKEQAIMVDASFQLKEGIKAIIDKLVTKIPFKKIEDEYIKMK